MNDLSKCVDAAMDIEAYECDRLDFLSGYAAKIIESHNLTSDDLDVIAGYQCIGTDNDLELIQEIREQLEEEKAND